jgi:hypothetical protein
MEWHELDRIRFRNELGGKVDGGNRQRIVRCGFFTTAGGKMSTYIARAYLPQLPALSSLRDGGQVVVSWPSADTDIFTLETTGTLNPPLTWISPAANLTDDGTNKSVTIPATNSAQFFRLRRP